MKNKLTLYCFNVPKMKFIGFIPYYFYAILCLTGLLSLCGLMACTKKDSTNKSMHFEYKNATGKDIQLSRYLKGNQYLDTLLSGEVLHCEKSYIGKPITAYSYDSLTLKFEDNKKIVFKKNEKNHHHWEVSPFNRTMYDVSRDQKKVIFIYKILEKVHYMAREK